MKKLLSCAVLACVCLTPRALSAQGPLAGLADSIGEGVQSGDASTPHSAGSPAASRAI